MNNNNSNNSSSNNNNTTAPLHTNNNRLWDIRTPEAAEQRLQTLEEEDTGSRQIQGPRPSTKARREWPIAWT